MGCGRKVSSGGWQGAAELYNPKEDTAWGALILFFCTDHVFSKQMSTVKH